MLLIYEPILLIYGLIMHIYGSILKEITNEIPERELHFKKLMKFANKFFYEQLLAAIKI